MLVALSVVRRCEGSLKVMNLDACKCDLNL